MKQRLASIILHPYVLSIANILILVLFYSSIKATWLVLKPLDHYEEAVELWDGYATILLGLGVVLEERSTLRKILKANWSEQRRRTEVFVEEVCHDYGVLLVVLGVVIELFAWLVKIPNEVLDSSGIEFVLLNIAAVAATIGAVLQLRFLYELNTVHARSRRIASEHEKR
jgi:hypothetical protein